MTEWGIPLAALIIAAATMVYTALHSRAATNRFNQMCENDLRHLVERLDRIETKLDEHLRWHLERRQNGQES